MASFGIRMRNHFSSTSDDELLTHVREIVHYRPNFGYRMVQACLSFRGLNIQLVMP